MRSTAFLKRSSFRTPLNHSHTEYLTDKKVHVKNCSDGSQQYIVSPYQMTAKEGKYYLICHFESYDDIAHYRLDRIGQLTILDETARPFETLQGSDGKRLDMNEYMKKHIYMFSSGNIRVKFRIVKQMVSDVIDIFGSDVRFEDETKEDVVVTANVDKSAMVQFAKSFAPDVTVISPQAVADEIKSALVEAVWNYEKLER